MTLPHPAGHAIPSPSVVDDDPLASPRIRALAMEIAYRLRPLCGDLPEGELVRLVTRIALVQQGSAKPGR
jgi:hypothetical protein